MKSKLTDKVLKKCQKDESTQKAILEKSIRGMKLNPDVLDEIIEKIYGIAGDIRSVGSLERNLEREWGVTLADVKKLAGNWTKQKSVKLPRGKTITKKDIRRPSKRSSTWPKKKYKK